jgi:hypothetical protein
MLLNLPVTTNLIWFSSIPSHPPRLLSCVYGIFISIITSSSLKTDRHPLQSHMARQVIVQVDLRINEEVDLPSSFGLHVHIG